MATWTGLGDNTELFWAILSQCKPQFQRNNSVYVQRRFQQLVKIVHIQEAKPHVDGKLIAACFFLEL
jgi:hypothetical protein